VVTTPAEIQNIPGGQEERIRAMKSLTSINYKIEYNCNLFNLIVTSIMTRYDLDSDYKSDSIQPDITVHVQLLSGDVLSFQHSPWKSIYFLKQTLRNYQSSWKPHLIELYQKDSEGEFVHCCPLMNHLKDGDHFYLFVKDDIVNESLYFVYTYQEMVLYRFVFLDSSEKRRSFTFTVSDQNQFSNCHQLYQSNGRADETPWYNTIEEMLENVMIDNESLGKEVRENMARLWIERRLH